MTREEVVEKLALKIRVEKPESERIVLSLLEIIEDGLKMDGKVHFRGFFSFFVVNKPETVSNLPGMPRRVIPAYKAPIVRFSQRIKDIVKSI